MRTSSAPVLLDGVVLAGEPSTLKEKENDWVVAEPLEGRTDMGCAEPITETIIASEQVSVARIFSIPPNSKQVEGESKCSRPLKKSSLGQYSITIVLCLVLKCF